MYTELAPTTTTAVANGAIEREELLGFSFRLDVRTNCDFDRRIIGALFILREFVAVVVRTLVDVLPFLFNSIRVLLRSRADSSSRRSMRSSRVSKVPVDN